MLCRGLKLSCVPVYCRRPEQEGVFISAPPTSGANRSLTILCRESMRFCRSMSSRYALMFCRKNSLIQSRTWLWKTTANTAAVNSRKNINPITPENCKTKALMHKPELGEVDLIQLQWYSATLVELVHTRLHHLFHSDSYGVHVNPCCSIHFLIFIQTWTESRPVTRTNLSRQMFSLRAPTQPAKPRVKVTPPTTRTNQTGSNPCRRVTWVRSSRTPLNHNRTERTMKDIYCI